MEVMNQVQIETSENEVGGQIACILACGGVCLITNAVGSAFATAASML